MTEIYSRDIYAGVRHTRARDQVYTDLSKGGEHSAQPHLTIINRLIPIL